MKICHVNLATGFSGGERQTLELIKQQVKEGFRLTVVLHPASDLVAHVKALDCDLILTSHFALAHSKYITLNCDIIHAHEVRAIYWAFIQHQLHGMPYIITRRIDNPLTTGWLTKKAYNNATALVGLSSVIVDKLSEFSDPQKIHKIPSSPVIYPVNNDEYDQICSQFRGKFMVIQAGNMLKHKGFDTTVAAAKSIGFMNPKVHFVLLGDGPERAQLEQDAKGLTNISFMGKQDNMGTWFAAANLFIHPSYSEGLGSVILEAMAAKLPVIGSNVGGIPDIIEDSVSGLLFEPGNHQQLAKLVSMLENDKSQCKSLVSGGKEKLKHFDIAYTASLYTHIYQSVIHEDLTKEEPVQESIPVNKES